MTRRTRSAAQKLSRQPKSRQGSSKPDASCGYGFPARQAWATFVSRPKPIGRMCQSQCLPAPRRSCDAWIPALSAALAPFHRCRSEAGADRALAHPSLSTSGETLTFEESMNLEGETGARRDVGDDYEWSCGWCCRRPRRPRVRARIHATRKRKPRPCALRRMAAAAAIALWRNAFVSARPQRGDGLRVICPRAIPTRQASDACFGG
jgi:hypothetical protein